MSETKDLLRRGVGEFEPMPDAFERVLVRRDRKQRNRRIGAGAVGVIVALATGIIFVRSLTSDPIPADPPVEPRPAPAPAGTLAYILDGDVYVADPDGSDAVKIADGISEDDCVSTEGFSFSAEGSMWSPDGRYLAYRRVDCSSDTPGTDENRGDVVISDAAGNVHATFPADGWQIAWSPDSTRVAVWDRVFEKVGVYGIDGARKRQLTMPSGWEPSGDHDPKWMRNGTLVVEAVELPLDGSAPRRLPLLARAGWDTDSPDGSRVAYTTGKSLVVAEADGSNPQEVFGDFAAFIQWSPAGDRIAFVSFVSTPFMSDGHLRLLDVATGTGTVLAKIPKSDYLSVIDFSPEGDRILFSRTETTADGADGVNSLWSIDADGSDLRRLVAGTAYGDWWAPTQTP